MPSIQSLTISPQTSLDFLDLSTIVQRVGHFLQRLNLDNLNLPSSSRESELLLCLRDLPSLVDIEISFDPQKSRPIQHFLTDVLMCPSHAVSASHTAKPGSEATRTYFLPNMKRFKFSGPVGVGILWLDDVLADLLQSRVLNSRPDTIAKLVSYEVNGTPSTDDSYLQDLLLGVVQEKR
ncbi:hypothetical protein B0H34DRAFT_133879 [Crassisporium funariophilum]|nr:hypothetical protein B0H34DRAFT_133879 [Crassisporium funariophilum]